MIDDADSAHLPWELLYHARAKLGFLSRHNWCVVSRRNDGSGDAPTQLPGPMRLLFFIASPEDLDAEKSRLDFEREEELLYMALEEPLKKGEIDIDIADGLAE